MELYHEIKENAYVLILAGALDGNNAGEVANMLQKALKSEKPKILIDCRQLNYISSAGIGIFLSNLPTVREQGKELIFYGLNESNRKVLHVLGLNDLIKITDEHPEAFENN